jgi:hypothetical protein
VPQVIVRIIAVVGAQGSLQLQGLRSHFQRCKLRRINGFADALEDALVPRQLHRIRREQTQCIGFVGRCSTASLYRFVWKMVLRHVLSIPPDGAVAIMTLLLQPRFHFLELHPLLKPSF